MNKPALDEGGPADNLEVVREVLAIVAAAIQSPHETRWLSLDGGLIRLLGEADDLLKWEIQRLESGGTE